MFAAPAPLRVLRCKIGCPGSLFTGRHGYRLTATPDGRTSFEHGEEFTGLLIPLLACLGLFRHIASMHVKMNDALKARVESLAVEAKQDSK